MTFTVEQRDALRERVLLLAGQDARIVAGAAVALVADVLADWTRTLSEERLHHGPPKTPRSTAIASGTSR